MIVLEYQKINNSTETSLSAPALPPAHHCCSSLDAEIQQTSWLIGWCGAFLPSWARASVSSECLPVFVVWGVGWNNTVLDAALEPLLGQESQYASLQFVLQQPFV